MTNVIIYKKVRLSFRLDPESINHEAFTIYLCMHGLENPKTISFVVNGFRPSPE
jgi:hypothetical protein